MKIFVTGGAGFMGSNFIRFFLNTRRNLQVSNLDKLTYAANPQSLADAANPRDSFFQGDIADPHAVTEAFEQEWYKTNTSWLENARSGQYLNYYKRHYVDRSKTVKA
jgi:nucleoside-diphosphate-sugar epimerase